MTATRPRHLPPTRPLTFGGLALLLFIGSGCAGSPNHYSPGTVPVAIRARPSANVQTLDLSKIATSYPSNELVGPGDVLEVTVSSGLGANETVTFPTRVSEDGQASLPVIGTVSLAGMELAETEAAIAGAAISRGLYRSPHITVTMKRRRVNRVTVMGAVKKPGVVELPSDACDLLAAINAAEGLDKDAGTHVEIRDPNNNRVRPGESAPNPIAQAGATEAGYTPAGGPELPGASGSASSTTAASGPGVLHVDLVSEVTKGTGSEKFRLGDGAVIRVEKLEPRPLQVTGLVKTPNTFDYPIGRDVRVLEAIAMAGGIASPVADKVYVIRPIPGQVDPAVIELKIGRAKKTGEDNLLLQPGDIVSVEQTPMTVFIDTIRLIHFGVSGTTPLL